MTPAKSYKTTMGGILAAVGLIATAGAGWAETGFDATSTGPLVAAVGAIVLAIFARDKDVSSEGTKIEKKK